MSPPYPLRAFLDSDFVAGRLIAGGMRDAIAKERSAIYTDIATAIRRHKVKVREKVHAFFVPGRIEVLGKHTDYAGGTSLVCAVERGLYVMVVPRSDRHIHMIDFARDSETEFDLTPDLQPQPGYWSNYPMTVARRIARNFPNTHQGASIGFMSDLPRSSGMSSSSALIIATFLALSAVNDLPNHPDYQSQITDRLSLAEYLGTIENGQTYRTLVGDQGVGTFGGSQDHTAILDAAAGHIHQYAYCPTRFIGAVPVPDGYEFAIGSSGVRAKKTGNAQHQYNRASRLATVVTEAWNKATERSDVRLIDALESSEFTPERMTRAVRIHTPADFVPVDVLDRFDHFYTENTLIIPAAVQALTMGNLEAFGRYADQSQRGAERLLKNQIPETIYLARTARELGAEAASAFGAGFGGSVWALVASEKVDSFIEVWESRYRSDIPKSAENACFFKTSAGPSAFQL